MLETLQARRDPRLAAPLAVLSVIFALALFVAGFDNGQLAAAFVPGSDPQVLHELTHDLRHAAGLPCH